MMRSRSASAGTAYVHERGVLAERTAAVGRVRCYVTGPFFLLLACLALLFDLGRTARARRYPPNNIRPRRTNYAVVATASKIM